MFATVPADQPALVVLYTNHKKETEIRQIQPLRVFIGSTEWHPEHQLQMECFDFDKQDTRTFAMKDIHYMEDALKFHARMNTAGLKTKQFKIEDVELFKREFLNKLVA